MTSRQVGYWVETTTSLVVMVMVLWATLAIAGINEALVEMAEKGDLEAVISCVKSGADVNTPVGRHHATALYMAAMGGHITVVNYLISQGANIDAKIDSNATPLIVASIHKQALVVRQLLAHGADVNAQIKGQYTALMAAIFMWSEGSADIVTQLLAHGADVNAQMNDGKTALTFAVVPGGSVKVVEELLINGADPNLKQIGLNDTELDTALGWAARMGEIDMVRLLLAHGADVNKRGLLGETPLKAAHAYPDIAELLRQHGGHE